MSTSTSVATVILQRMAEVLRRPLESLRMDTELALLAPDSFVLVEMVIELQDEFDVRFSHQDIPGLRTVGDVVALVEKQLAT